MSKLEKSHALLAEAIERDLTRDAREGLLPRAFAVEDQIDQVVDVLLSGKFPIVTGDSGVGKTALLFELVYRIPEQDNLAPLRGKRILQFSLRNMASRLKKPNQMGEAFQKFLGALQQVGQDIIPYFRDIHLAYDFDLEAQFQGLGYRTKNPVLGEGLRTTLNTMFEYNPDLERSYFPIYLEEPNTERMEQILTGWNSHRSPNGHPQFTEEALEQALHVSFRFLSNSFLPRKTIDLLEQVETMAGPQRPIDAATVTERFCARTKVPRNLVDLTLPLDMADLEQRFRGKVLGQGESVDAVLQVIAMIKAGLSDMRRPFGVFLFVGPTGVGKTHVAQLLARFLFGQSEKLIRFNMADYQSEPTADSLFGNVNGRSIQDRRGLLTQRLSGHAFGVLLLDEFEKSHLKVRDRFLQLVDEGQFINGASETISCRSMIIIATSNAGAGAFHQSAIGFIGKRDTAQVDREVDVELHREFRRELLNRFDKIVHFHPLGREHIRAIAAHELDELSRRFGMGQRALHLESDESVLDWLAVNGYDPQYGARYLRRSLERNVTSEIADFIVRRNPPPGSTLQLTVRANRIRAILLTDPQPAEAKPAPSPPLPTHATEILDEARQLLDNLERHTEACSEILAQMNQPGFWDHRDENQDLLQEFRKLDVIVQTEKRLAAPIQRLGMLAAEGREPSRGHIQDAQYALQEWKLRVLQESAQKVWLVISSADPIHPDGAWIYDLTSMELEWCRHLRLEARIAAFETRQDQPQRVVLEIEGAGAAFLLGMEAGLHRMKAGRERDAVALIEVIPTSESDPDPTIDIQPTRQVETLQQTRGAYRTRIHIEDHGLRVVLVGDDPDRLRALTRDIQTAWQALPETPPEIRRIYDIGQVVDPSLGVTGPRLKQVLKGKLDRFHDAWKSANLLSKRHSGQS